MPGGRETAHVDADLTDDHRRREVADAGNGGQSRDGGPKGRQTRREFGIDVCDCPLERVDLLEMQAQQQPLRGAEPALQCRDEMLRTGQSEADHVDDDVGLERRNARPEAAVGVLGIAVDGDGGHLTPGGVRTVGLALAAADAEFSQNACEGARENAKKYGFQIVYDKSCPPPPKTTDFTPVVRALQAANADMVVVCSYPADSVGIVEAANEIGLKPKMFGGAMVGLQVTAFKEKLKGKLNGLVNYETWVPDKKQMYKGTEAFFKEYQERAKGAGVDPLGYYLGGWGYAYVQILGDAIKGAKSVDDDKLAAYLKANKFETIMGPVKFGAKGEWAEGRMLTVQYHDIKPDADMKTWAGMSYQTVLHPSNLATGKMIFPYEKAHQ